MLMIRSMDTLQPKQLGNKYLLLDRIGTGGMAEVYRCRMSGTMGFEKLMVVKKLLPQFASDQELVSQFIAEARLAALLHHENIAYVYDFGEIDGSYFIAMEYLLGKDLRSVMRKAGEMHCPIGVERALTIAMRICEGMEYAHTLHDLHQRPLNIIHRDLSPHNVFITSEGKVKIIDFGIAKAELFDNRTKAGMVKGKISYMSPEQLTAEKIDRRSDIFSIGILLYEMLCGRRMYTGDTAALIRKCMQAEYERLEGVMPGLHPAIYRILDRALARDRDERYDSCAGMHADLVECHFAITGRPAPQSLQEYLFQLFAEELEEERLKVSAGMPQQFPDPVMAHPRPDPAGHESTAIQPTVEFRAPSPERPWRRIHRWAILVAVGFVAIATVMALRTEGPVNQGEPAAVVSPAQSRAAGESQTAAPPEMLPEEPPLPEDRGQNVQVLLAEAERAMAGEEPEQQLGLALDAFREVLAREPGNGAALAGIGRIGEQYGRHAEQAMRAGNFPEAAEFLRHGLAVAPDSQRLLDLQENLAKEKRETIRDLADRAEEALTKNQLTTPPEDCAYKYYQQILVMDGNNAQAKNGLVRIADRYAALAEEAYRNLRIGNAREYVRQGLAIVPQHKHLLQLQRDLSRSKPGMFFKSIEKSIRPIFQ